MKINKIGVGVKKYFKLEFILVLSILVVAFIIRIFRVDQILAFHYDQGRDALVIWDLINAPHKLFLIGPTTGLAGVFRGPFYYYLIAPFYWLGNGNPIFPEVFLAALSTLALLLMYFIGREIGGKKSGLIALILGAFSFEIIYASRWLSNPTPMLLLSMLLVWCLFKIQDGKKNFWILLSFVLGLSFFHFGSSGELFYFPAVLLFALVFKKFPDIKTFLISIFVFFLTFAPLFIFNIKHDGILQNNVGGLLESGKSFGIPSWQFLLDRLELIGVYFSATIFHNPFAKEMAIMFFGFVAFILSIPELLKNQKAKVILILLGSVTIGLLFYQGNNGSLYQYYLTGYYLIFLLLAAMVLSKIFNSNWVGKIIFIYFLLFFLFQNWSLVKPYISTTGQETNTIVLANQIKAIDWIYQNSQNRDFNVDVYVPPVISHSYDYLFKWLGKTKYKRYSVEQQVPLLYTLYEADPDHPERLKAWLDRQAGIGSIIKEETFGGITVQERTRLFK